MKETAKAKRIKTEYPENKSDNLIQKLTTSEAKYKKRKNLKICETMQS
jgi:hypothetical protein